MSSHTLIKSASLKSNIKTLAPSFKKVSAAALPIPPAPPVIIATLPSSLPISFPKKLVD